MLALPPRPGYEIRIEDCAERVRVIFNGVPVADSARAKILTEGRLAPAYYFPRADVRMDLLRATALRTYCPFRGNASHWTLTVGGRSAENSAWSYEDPYEDATAIKGYVAFYRERMDAIALESERPAPRAALASPEAANPLVGWLLREAPAAPSARDLVEQFARAMLAGGIPAWRLWLSVRTLHPQLIGTNFVWEDNGKGVQQSAVPREMLLDQRFLDSPVKAIFDGAGGLRRRLDAPRPQLDFPILHELHAQGATDYVVMPFVFTSGQINAFSLSTRRPGGFSTADLGYVYEVLPLLSRVFEVHAMRLNAVNLLDVYLGKQSGAKVLDGLFKRGDGEDVHAVIWFSDLRNSTRLADSMPRRKFLALLDEFFDCSAGAVLEHGGEVLRFIGDASLAIFPISEADAPAAQIAQQASRACESALSAALEAHLRLREANARRMKAGALEIDLGIGLHVGDVMYGNIGTPDRLEFSVIGAAANEAARIEAMCKTLETSPVVSAAFARHVPERLRPLGRHALRGVAEPQELYTLRA
jgi:adenylate cyclase